jgi:hypothetical protein
LSCPVDPSARPLVEVVTQDAWSVALCGEEAAARGVIERAAVVRGEYVAEVAQVSER